MDVGATVPIGDGTGVGSPITPGWVVVADVVVGAGVAATAAGSASGNSRPSPDAHPAARNATATATAVTRRLEGLMLRPGLRTAPIMAREAPTVGTAPSHRDAPRPDAIDDRLRIVDSMTCQSCGAEADELHAVRRKYVTPGSWDQEQSERTVDEVEHWCFACLTHYPHERA